MARGRMISKDITIDKKMNNLSDDTSRLAFTWLIAHADREGRTPGDPAVVRSMLFPRRSDISVPQMEGYIREWAAAGLVQWYEANDDLFIAFPNFDKHQIGLRKEREPASTIPAPPEEPPTGGTPPPPPAPDDGEQPDDSRKDAGSLPDEIPVKGREGKGKESRGGKPPRPPSDIPKHPERQELLKHFCMKTSLPVPRMGTDTEIKAAQKLWWTPLDEILGLVDKDVGKAEKIIDTSLLRLSGLTVCDPNSIIKTARAVYAESKNGNGTKVYGEEY